MNSMAQMVPSGWAEGALRSISDVACSLGEAEEALVIHPPSHLVVVAAM